MSLKNGDINKRESVKQPVNYAYLYDKRKNGEKKEKLLPVKWPYKSKTKVLGKGA